MINPNGYWIPDAVTADILLIAKTPDYGIVGLFIERDDSSGTEPGKIAIPGGHMDETDEDLEDAAIRELEEEVGIKINKDQLEFIGPFSKKNRDPRGRYITMAYYAVVDAEILQSAVAGSDANQVAVYELNHVVTEDMAFDHKEIVLALKGKLGL